MKNLRCLFYLTTEVYTISDTLSIVHDSYTIVIGGADSMRKRKGIIEEA